MQNGDKFECDNCGGDAGNGGVNDCAVVSDLETNDNGQPTGKVLNYHFCRANKCDRKVIRKVILVHFLSKKEKSASKKKGKKS